MSATESATPSPSPLRRLFALADAKVNPVLLRDLRLYMRGRMMLAAYFLTLIALVLLAVLYTVIARFDNTDGTGLLSILTSLLAVICGAMIPNLVFERFRSELSNRATELALTSPLTPAQLVRGKLLGAWCMVLMVVSAATPMLATSYLLGGINLLSIFGVVGGVTLAGFIMPILQLYMAADHKGGKGASRAIAALLFVSQLVMMVGYANLLNSTFFGRGYRSTWSYSMLVSLIIAGVLIGQFLYCCTVGIIRGEAEDRDVAPRVSLSAAAVVGGISAFFVLRHLDPGRFLSGHPSDFWEALMVSVCIVAYAFCGGFTAVTYSSPVIPRNLHEKWGGRRLRSLFLLPGTASLSAYFLLNAALLFILPMLLGATSSFFDIDDWWYYLCLALAPYMANAYGIVAYYYVVLPFSGDRRNPKLLSHTITIANVLLAFVAIFAMVLVSYVWGRSDFYQFILGVTPVGLVAACMDSADLEAGAGAVGFLVSGILTLLLLVLIWKSGAENKPASGKDENAA